MSDRPHTGPPPDEGRGAQPTGVLQLGFAAVLGLAVMGFFVGTAQPPSEGSPLVQHDGVEVAGSELVPTYREAQRRASGPGMDWEGELAALRGPGVLDPVDLDGTSKDVALSERSANRAYDGAPPTIPHPVRQSAAAECLACHEDGMRLRGAIASPMSHTEYASCTQCHVVSEGPVPGATLPPDATYASNSFVGLESPDEGERAWGIAPPEIPHKTHMREDCMSCHGPNGRDAMRSTHPDRQSCEQCHAPNAVLDQRPVSAVMP